MALAAGRVSPVSVWGWAPTPVVHNISPASAAGKMKVLLFRCIRFSKAIHALGIGKA